MASYTTIRGNDMTTHLITHIHSVYTACGKRVNVLSHSDNYTVVEYGHKLATDTPICTHCTNARPGVVVPINH